MYGETEATKVEFKMFIYEFKFLSSKLSLIPGEYAYYSCSYKKEGILQEKYLILTLQFIYLTH